MCADLGRKKLGRLEAEISVLRASTIQPTKRLAVKRFGLVRLTTLSEQRPAFTLESVSEDSGRHRKNNGSVGHILPITHVVWTLRPQDYLGQIVSGSNAVHSSNLVYGGLLFFSNVRAGILSNEVSRQASIRLPRDPPEARQGREDGVPCSDLTGAKQEYDNHQSERTRLEAEANEKLADVYQRVLKPRVDRTTASKLTSLSRTTKSMANDPEALPEFDACIVQLSADIERMAPNPKAIEDSTMSKLDL
ncbi:hypothetical protein BU15DRAFT_82534 [Melanogaster broomeanus]|nr:hypothetical protein BU15DRAFT_82534 [Melanogaster broomeanus]